MDQKNYQSMDHQMKQELDRIQDSVDSIDQKLMRIEAFLSGNELDREDKGLIGRVNDLEKRVLLLEKWKDRIFWTLIGMGIPAGIGIYNILEKIFIK